MVTSGNLTYRFMLVIASLLIAIGNVQISCARRDLPYGYRPGSIRDPGACARELVDWCRDQDFSIDVGMSSNSYQGTESGFSCTTSSRKGIKCTRDNSDWFQCGSDNVLVFRGRPLTSSSRDRDVCNLRNQYFKAVYDQKETGKRFDADMDDFGKSMDRMFGGFGGWFGK